MKRILIICLLFLCSCSVSLAAKQGYCKSFEVCEPDPNEIELFTVPADERFVMAYIYVYATGRSQWSLVANDNFSIKGSTYPNSFHVYPFPDTMIFFDSEETLFLIYDTDNNYLTVTILGYFEDLQNNSNADLTGDDLVNFDDFAVFADQWLDGI